MDLSLERDSSGLGSLFQQIINDMKNSSPLWEDFVAKAGKLHACLRAAIQAISSYLDAFQKIADAATNSRGASKEIGTALTRVCLRHKAVETRLKTFTAAIMDCLVQPLQEKLEDWKRTVASLDKEHAKEYKRCRTELKKRSTDTLRLQKKARKGQTDTIQSLMDSHMQDVTLRRAELEEVEKKSLRSAMIEERLRYCTFVHMLQPVVREECEVMSELGHLQEAMESIANVTKDPNILPQASEELIHDAKATMTLYPESPVGGSGSAGGCSNSLGSRKSSVCSISSMNSSGSSSSPGHHHYSRSISQLISPAIRLKPGESSDSGFCSSPALTLQASNATSQSHAVATWPPHCQDANVLPTAVDRPHTISTAYEKGHTRPQLTVYTFQNPDTILEAGSNGACNESMGNVSDQTTPLTQKPPINVLNRPPLPVRCSSLERPLSANNNRNGGNLMQRQCPSPIPAHITKELSMHHAQQQLQQQQQQPLYQQQLHQQQQPAYQPLQSPPTYVNMSELAHMAAAKACSQQQQQQQTPSLQQQQSIESVSSQHSNDSASTASNTKQQSQQLSHGAQAASNNNTPLTRSVSSSTSSNTPSLHSHPSIESTVATSLIGQTPTPSSGSSTPQNHYSPLLTNSPSSTAAGTPSGGSMTSGMTTGFVYNVNSPTPPPSATTNNTSSASDALKITEVDNAQNSTIANNDNSNDNATEQANSSTTDTDWSANSIVENDVRSRASVLQKASMFEKQAAAAASNNSLPPVAARPAAIDTGIYGTRRAEDNNRFIEIQQEQQEQQSEVSDAGNATRIARRSSINTAKPPPPVRRSSSVTPTPKSGNGTFRTSSPGIYAQPKAVNAMSSFRSASPGPNGHPLTASAQLPPQQPKTNPNLIAQLNARLSKQQKPEGIYGSTPTSPIHQSNHAQQANELVYMRNNYAHQQQQQQQQQTQHYTDGYGSVSIEKTGSIRAKTKAEFLENLNSKLAKQNISGRAFAVRNLINSKALPDPRICHESLMDQIKRGATLKRNQKINDRSAPKIH